MYISVFFLCIHLTAKCRGRRNCIFRSDHIRFTLRSGSFSRGTDGSEDRWRTTTLSNGSQTFSTPLTNWTRCSPEAAIDSCFSFKKPHILLEAAVLSFFSVSAMLQQSGRRHSERAEAVRPPLLLLPAGPSSQTHYHLFCTHQRITRVFFPVFVLICTVCVTLNRTARKTVHGNMGCNKDTPWISIWLKHTRTVRLWIVNSWESCWSIPPGLLWWCIPPPLWTGGPPLSCE